MANPDNELPLRRVLGPTVAGSWYPSDPQKLGRQIDGFLTAADDTELPSDGRTIVGVIAPHAGFVYSGAVAGRAFRLFDPRAVRRVILLGPSHYASFRGARLPRADAYRTPLGQIKLDGAAIRTLLDAPLVAADDDPFEREHCLEAELPFLQRILPRGFLLIPLLIGAATPIDDRLRIADRIRSLVDGETVVVVSSDFTHYGAGFDYLPFRVEVPDKIRALDMGAVERIVGLDREGFDAYVTETGATICGRAAIDVLLGLLPDRTTARLVAYDTSGRMTGDWSHSVSYAAIGFWKRR